ncbi:MAG: transcriptional repressor LexA [bacterium]|nr:transcriptional repressor LexA [bacterium]
MVSDQLTRKQQEVYDFIRQEIADRGFPPAVRDIAKHFNIKSPNGVMCHLKALTKKGYIRRTAEIARGIELLRDEDCPVDGLPLVGRVAAGVMHEAVEQEERINFGEMFQHPDFFTLEVSGESMIEAHIADGDYVVVRKQPRANKGQMAVVRTEEGEATLKFWHPEANRIRLQPANASMRPIYVKNAEVLGVVVGVVRNYGK